MPWFWSSSRKVFYDCCKQDENDPGSFYLFQGGQYNKSLSSIVDSTQWLLQSFIKGQSKYFGCCKIVTKTSLSMLSNLRSTIVCKWPIRLTLDTLSSMRHDLSVMLYVIFLVEDVGHVDVYTLGKSYDE